MNPVKDSPGRQDWVDVLKFLGIYAIYLGHFGAKAGKFYPFVFLYHVPLFFFAAGFFSIKRRHETLPAFIRQKFVQLMVPYFVFAAFALVYFSIARHFTFSQVLEYAGSFMTGIRNQQVLAGSLWFIPCMFFIAVLYFSLLKLLGNVYSVLAASFVIFVLTQTVLPFNPVIEPSWILNIDSALYYLVFYAAGTVAFPLLTKEYRDYPSGQRTSLAVLLSLSVVITLVCFFEGGSWFPLQLSRIFPPLEGYLQGASFFIALPIVFALINTNIALAKILGRVKLLQDMGKATLIYCGTEDVFKHFLLKFFKQIGMPVRLTTPFLTLLFTAACLAISFFTVVRFYNMAERKIKEKIHERRNRPAPSAT